MGKPNENSWWGNVEDKTPETCEKYNFDLISSISVNTSGIVEVVNHLLLETVYLYPSGSFLIISNVLGNCAMGVAWEFKFLSLCINTDQARLA